MAILSDEKVASLTRRLVDTVIDYKKEAERLAMENENLRAALQDIADGMGESDLAEVGRYAKHIARAALGGIDD